MSVAIGVPIDIESAFRFADFFPPLSVLVMGRREDGDIMDRF